VVWRTGLLKLGRKTLIELVEDLLPVNLTFGDFIQLLFHPGRKPVIHQVGEGFVQPIRDNVTQFFRIETTILQVYIAAVLDRGNDRRVGGWPADPRFSSSFTSEASE